MKTHFSELWTLTTGLWAKERTRLLLWAPVAMACGIGAYFGLKAEPSGFAGGSLLTGCAALLFFCRRRERFRLLVVALLLAALGFALAQERTRGFEQPLIAKKLVNREVTGVVAEVQHAEDGGRLVLDKPAVSELAPKDTPKRLRITFRKALPEVSVGDTVTVNATLYPLPEPTHPGAFDFARYLYFEGIGATGYTAKAATITQPAQTRAAEEALDALRQRMAEDMRARIGGAEGAIAAALTVGDMNAVPDEARDIMRDSGLYHILSISGLHLALAAGIVFFSVRLALALIPAIALRYNVKKIAAFAAFFGGLIYLLLAGSPVPALRSFIMVSATLFAVLLDRRGISMHALCWAAMLILLVQPESLLGASFQMSFAATLAIVSLYERYGGALYKPESGWIRKLWVAVFATALTSLAATLATTPFVLYHFNRFQPWGLLANVLVMPLTSFLIMPGVVLTFLLMPLGLESLGYFLMEWGIRGMLLCARLVADLPYAAMNLSAPSFAGFLSAVLGVLWFTLWQGRVRRLGIVFFAFGLATSLFRDVPDIWVSDDGKQVAVREQDHLAMVKGTGRSFTVQAWLRSAGLSDTIVAKNSGNMECGDTHCLYRHANHTVLIMTDWKTVKALCRELKADAVVATFYMRPDECPDASPRIDRNDLQHNGAYMFFIKPREIVAEHVRAHQGVRPWVPVMKDAAYRSK